MNTDTKELNETFGHVAIGIGGEGSTVIAGFYGPDEVSCYVGDWCITTLLVRAASGDIKWVESSHYLSADDFDDEGDVYDGDEFLLWYVESTYDEDDEERAITDALDSSRIAVREMAPTLMGGMCRNHYRRPLPIASPRLTSYEEKEVGIGGRVLVTVDTCASCHGYMDSDERAEVAIGALMAEEGLSLISADEVTRLMGEVEYAAA